MSWKLQIIMLLTSLGGFAGIILLIRNDILDLKYCLIWLLAAGSAVILSCMPSVLLDISILIGIQTPVNTLFLIGFYFVFILMVSMTIIISKNTIKLNQLNQEIAILKARLERISNNE